jgi:hypothetical protein
MATPDVEPEAHPAAEPGTQQGAAHPATPPATPPAVKRSVKPDHLPTDTYVVVSGSAARPTSPTSPANPTQQLPDAATERIASPAQQPRPEAAASAPRVVNRSAVAPPKKRSNRPFGALLTLAATVVFAAIFAVAILVIFRLISDRASLSYLANPGYWVPVLFFLIGLLLATLVINRGGWWAHIVGSLGVGLFVWIGSAAVVTLITLYVYRGSATLIESMSTPFAVAGGVIAREIALWVGVILGHRGRTLKQRNLDDRAAFDRERQGATPGR